MTRFVIEVVVDPRKASAGAKKVRTELDKTETAAAKMGKTLRRAFGAAAIVAGIATATRTLASFSQEMSTVAAVTQATTRDFERLQSAAVSLGTNTRFTATQAAEGMTFLARAGFEATEVLDTIEDTLFLAQAGALGLGQAADIASNALTAFRLDTSEAGRVVDVLALAANSANTTVAQLGDGLKLVAPIAAGVGVTIEETTAAISALSNAGLQATLAGTGLRRIISELESPSAKTRATLADLNLETEDYKVSSVGLTTALRALAQAGVDTGLGLEIFGDRGGPAFEVLSKSLDDVEAFTVSLNNADGTARRIAETMDDNLNGSILAMKSAFEGLILATGDAGATGALRGFFDVSTAGLRVLAGNIGLVTNAIVIFGTAFAAVRLAPFAESALASAKAFTVLNLALAKGTAQSLVGAVAVRTRAQANVDAARTALASTRATQGAVLAEQHRTTALVLGSEASFASVATERQLAALRAQAVTQTEALAVANVKLGTATAAATVKAKLLALVSPFGLFVAGAAAAGVALSFFLDHLNEVRDATLRATEEGEKFGKVGFERIAVDVARVTAELKRLNDQADRDVEKFGAVNPNLLRLLESAEIRLQDFVAAQNLVESGSVANAAAANRQVAALNELNRAITDVVDGFEKENELLALNSREREVQIALIEEVNALQESGAKLTDADKAELEGLIRRNQALREQSEAFESIRGPQAAYDARLAALNTLQVEGRISAQELQAAIVALGQAAGNIDLNTGGNGDDAAADLEKEIALIQRKAVAQREQAVILRELDGGLAALQARQVQVLTLEQEGVITGEQATASFASIAEALRLLNPEYSRMTALIEEINGPTERLVQRQADLENLISNGADVNGRYADELERVRAQLNPLSEEEQRRAELLESINGPQVELIATLAELDALLASNTINATQYREALEALGVASETANTAVGGFKVGLKNARAEMTDVQGAAQALAENGFRAAEDALVSFVTTGELDFDAFVDGLIDDIARLLVKQALLAAIGGGGAGGSGFLGALFGATEKAEGGSFNANETLLVGEEGPEILTPSGGGTITPAGETAAILKGASSGPPIVNVAAPSINIRNVIEGDDEDAREDEVMNIINRNKSAVRGVIG